ncbi:MAG TPA: substrate-binding and VWA domain-containing protein [Frankiaceae bacterium]|nr:substrate-binding and VWA domain-containing protein [Frankiaceae bacterium]
MPQSRSRAPLVIAVVVGIILIAVVRSRVGGSSSDGEDRPEGGDAIRTECTVVNVAASSEKAALMRDIAAAYNRTDRKAAGHCVQANVFSKASGGGMDALAKGWDPEVDGGPNPDVWSPASSSWAVLLRQRTAAQDKPDLVPGDKPGDLPSIARTPLVIAMPKPMAEALGWPNKALGWGDLLALTRDPAGWGRFGHPEWGAFRLGKTNPNFSTSGLNATIGAYFAATGVSSDLTAGQVNDPKTHAYVKGVEQAVVHYGDTTLTFLSNLQAADDRGQGLSYISAATIEEKSVWDYNEGNPTGDPSTLGKHPKPAVPLAAIYPKEGTLYSDNPFVILRASWVSDEKRAAAEDFLNYLQLPGQQVRFVDAAFRDFHGKGGDKINRANGMLPDQPKLVLSPPAPAVLDLVQRSWGSLRKRARVLEVIDVSGSMGEDVPKAGQTKLELAKKAAIRALEQYAPDDEVGLWIFSTPQPGRSTPWLELVPIAPVSQNLQSLRSRIGSLTPVGGTALYASVRESVRFVRSSFDPTRINAVVFLTDGKNEYPADTNVQSLLQQLQAEDESVAVRVFTIAYGDNADLPTLRAIALASRGAAYDASDPDSIDKVFTAVISNF